MLKAIAIVSFALVSSSSFAQSSGAFEKKHYHYNDWTKGRFAEAVTVVNPGKWIFLAGVGSEAEKDGNLLVRSRGVRPSSFGGPSIRGKIGGPRVWTSMATSAGIDGTPALSRNLS